MHEWFTCLCFWSAKEGDTEKRALTIMATLEELPMPRPSKTGSEWKKGKGPNLLSGSYTISKSPSVGAGRVDLAGLARSMTPDINKFNVMKSPSLGRRKFFDHSSTIGSPSTFRKQMTIETDRILRQQTEVRAYIRMQ